MSENSTAHDGDLVDDATADALDDDLNRDDAEGLAADRAAEADDVMRELAETRRRLAEVPAAQVIANHAMGLFELAAIHLSAGKEHLPEGALAIDAMGALVEGLADRLGPQESVLKDALAQIRLAFVQVKATHAD
jgi:hypothetical protein